jgi:hypothetical protein
MRDHIYLKHLINTTQFTRTHYSPLGERVAHVDIQSVANDVKLPMGQYSFVAGGFGGEQHEPQSS